MELGPTKTTDLEQMIQSQGLVDEAPSPLEPARRLHTLALAYLQKHSEEGDLKDLEQSIVLLNEALTTISEDHPDHLDCLQLLDYALHKQHDETGSVADLEQRVNHKEKISHVILLGYSYRISQLESLVNLYGDLYQAARAISVLEKCIRVQLELLDVAPLEHPDRAYWFGRLGVDYRERYLRADDYWDLEKSIRARTKALSITEPDDPERPYRLRSLANAHEDVYQVSGAVESLQTSIKLHQEALETVEVDDLEKVDFVESLGLAYGKRYKLLGTLADLEESLRLYHEALRLLPSDHPNRHPILDNLGVGYGDRYQWKQDLADLERSIQSSQEAIDTMPANSPAKASMLQNLAVGYWCRYKRLGAFVDLEVSIQLKKEALDLTASDQKDYPSRARSLGYSYIAKYDRMGDIADLEKSLDFASEVLDLTHPADPQRADRLHDLASRYVKLYQVSKDVKDLDRSFDLAKQALDTTVSGEHNPSRRADYLHLLGIVHRERYKIDPSEERLKMCIKAFHDALNATPLDHVDRADRLRMVAIGHEMRFFESHENSGASGDLEAAVQCYGESLACSAPPNIRLRSGKNMLTLLTIMGKWEQAYEASLSTMDLIPLMTPRSLESLDRRHLLAEVVGLASDAAAIALNASKTPFEALQLLELGRGVIAGSLSDLHPDMTELQRSYSQLAGGFITLRSQLQDSAITGKLQADQRYDAAKRMEELTTEIRSLPGLERFLLAPTGEEVRRLAEYGPIVVINVSDYRCDALIIEEDGIRAIDLPLLSSAKIQGYLNQGLASVEVLEWLWESVAQPILDVLGFTEPPSGDDWSHVWWIPTGHLARFPIHAAGIYSKASTDTVLDRVVSSYSTSLKVLSHSRRLKAAAASTKSSKATLIGMPHTRAQSSLQYASEEIRKLESLCAALDIEVCTPAAIHDEVLSALKDCTVFHFAGHAMVNSLDPMKSCLLLQDWESAPLTVQALLEANLQNEAPFLAYLSACGTGQSRSDALMDENIHIIGAFQLAGFQHVIGSLWYVNDETCVEMAALTYKSIQVHGMNGNAVSRGLHDACRRLRQKWVVSNAARAWSGNSMMKRSTQDTAQKTEEQSTLTPRDEVNGRNVVSCEDDLPLHWVPYVLFGV